MLTHALRCFLLPRCPISRQGQTFENHPGQTPPSLSLSCSLLFLFLGRNRRLLHHPLTIPLRLRQSRESERGTTTSLICLPTEKYLAIHIFAFLASQVATSSSLYHQLCQTLAKVSALAHSFIHPSITTLVSACLSDNRSLHPTTASATATCDAMIDRCFALLPLTSIIALSHLIFAVSA